MLLQRQRKLEYESFASCGLKTRPGRSFKRLPGYLNGAIDILSGPRGNDRNLLTAEGS